MSTDNAFTELLVEYNKLVLKLRNYQELCAAAYQAAGAYDLPERFLDALSDAADNRIEDRRLTSGLLPVQGPGLGSYDELRTKYNELLTRFTQLGNWYADMQRALTKSTTKYAEAEELAKARLAKEQELRAENELLAEVISGLRTMRAPTAWPQWFALLKPRVFKDGNQWCVLYGANLQEGFAGFGDTPREAAEAFCAEWDRAAEKVSVDASASEKPARVPFPRPGEILMKEYVTPASYSLYWLAPRLGITELQAAEIAAGTRPITADIDLKLSVALGTPKGFWTGLQEDYDRRATSAER